MQAFGPVRRVEIAGEDGLIFYAAGASLAELNQQIALLHQALSESRPDWLLELVPSYDSLMLVFDMTEVDYHRVYQYVATLPVSTATTHSSSTLHRLPVWYGAPEANDLALVSQATGIPEADIIQRHQAQTYTVYAVGFAPGFAYLGELDAGLATPRLANPRKAVPKGAVAIADRQTAVYPDVSPGGWHLLGLCPVALYTPGCDKPVLMQAGDQVEFYAISEAQYHAWPAEPEDN
ncbi:5-oxoprolinase subunit PxpB [Alteromonas lipolytica]|uniref:Carboxyltransferase domain-containing protein n=1 Tax=Alteromonas lipolytica TaxID=1856405 RepID=A0A1E8FIT8_9ALTE|nr:5-oxoprolinase subunit PxpB [Alteromonas lipolytica]OFI35859.1 hypothetical protein BFC17_11320 [Alteromonas lipolytica]GGF81440.1 allophanate hydrolase [Alteromonas lipolytica]